MRISVSALVALALSSASSTASAFVPANRALVRSTSRIFSTETETGASVTPSSDDEQDPRHILTPFQAAREQTEQMLASSIDNPALLEPLKHFVAEYFGASQAAYKADPKPEYNGPQATAKRFLKGIELGVKFGMGPNKYVFGSAHTALRGKNPDKEDGNTYDYYEFGCDFFRPFMDQQNSVVLGQDHLQEAVEKLAAGENVVFLANHQSEADPQVFSCMMEKCGFGQQAEEITYVAGHKVTTDPLAIPFSMGRNLICIHSKKHIDADPETKSIKQRQNLSAMSGMLGRLKKGGTGIWVAPSGGRDRRNLETGEVPIAPFDSKTIDMFRLMGNKSKVKTHYYPLAMMSYDLCPPPDFVDAGVGEQRNVRFVPVGIACGPELASRGGLESRHEFCKAAEQSTAEDYAKLLEHAAANTKQ